MEFLRYFDNRAKSKNLNNIYIDIYSNKSEAKQVYWIEVIRDKWKIKILF